MLRVTAVAAVLTLVLGSITAGMLFAPAAEASTNTPTVSFGATGSMPGGLLAGEKETFTVDVSNVTDEPWFNLSLSLAMPTGVSFSPSTGLGAPTIYPSEASLPRGGTVPAGENLWVWEDISDLPAGAARSLTVTVVPAQPERGAGETDDPEVFPVGSTLEPTVGVFASADARYLPVFLGGTGVSTADAVGQTRSSAPETAKSMPTALRVTKTEPSAESELMRGVHDYSTPYTITVQNTAEGATNDVVLVDYLHAGLEFLGCGEADNTAGGRVEFSGAGRLDATTPVVVDCIAPSAVKTVEKTTGANGFPATLTNGVYTKVTWQLGTLAAGETLDVTYRAGIPLRMNTMIWDNDATVEGLGATGQAANLDNNNGASTRHGVPSLDVDGGVDGQVYNNEAEAVGAYTGVVRTGTDREAQAGDTEMVHSMDLRVLKSVDAQPDNGDPGVFGASGEQKFVTGQLAKYTLQLKSSEYAASDAITLYDVIPNGLCPILPTGTPVQTGSITIPGIDGNPSAEYTGGALPLSCELGATDYSSQWQNPAVSGATVDWVAYDNASGRFILKMSVDSMTSTNATDRLTDRAIVYPVRMRGNYTGQEGTTTSLDRFTNTVVLVASTTGEQGREAGVRHAVADDSAASIIAGPTGISKKVLPRENLAGGVCPSDPALYVDGPTGDNLNFVYGDRVCYELTVDFETDVDTRNPLISDRFPAGITYEGSVAKLSASDNSEIDDVDFRFDDIDGVLTWAPSTHIAGNGDRLVPRGTKLVIQVWGTVTSQSAAAAALDKPENLMKYQQENVDGEIFFLRDQAETFTDAGLQLVKGVRDVDGDATRTARTGANVDGTVFGSNRDGIQVVEGEDVTYRIDLSHVPQAIENLAVEDTLPAGIAASDVSAISDGGVVDDRGAAGVFIVWTDLGIDKDATRTLSYVITVPVGTGLDVTLQNTAAITEYNYKSNAGDAVTTLTPGQDGVPTGGTVDNSDVFLPIAAVDKQLVSTQLNPTGGAYIDPNNASTQVTQGELATFEYSVTIPAHTSAQNGVLSDAVPAGFTVSQADCAGPTGADCENTPGHPDFHFTSDPLSTDPAPGTLTFPEKYANETNQPQKFTVTLVGFVAGDLNNGQRLNNRVDFVSDSWSGHDTAQVTYIEPNPSITKVASKRGDVAIDDVITYTLTASNQSGRPIAYDNVVTDTVPVGLIVDESKISSGGIWDASKRTITWTIAQLSSSTTLTYQAKIDPLTGGAESFTNEVDILSYTLPADLDPTASERRGARTSGDTETITAIGAAIDKGVRPAGSGDAYGGGTAAPVGETAEYAVTVTLPANINFYDPVITDTLPTGMVLVDGSAVGPTTIDGTWTLSQVGNVLTWTHSGDIASAVQPRTVELSYTVKLTKDVVENAAALPNTARFAWNKVDDSTDPADRVTIADTATVTVLRPHLDITKYVEGEDAEDAATGVFADPESTVEYRIDVTHPGGTTSSTAHDVIVTDTVPVGLSDVTPVNQAGVTHTSSTTGGITTVVWTITKIEPGETISLSYTTTMAPSADLGTKDVLRNVAGITEYWSVPGHGQNPDARRYTGGTDPANVKPAFPAVIVTKAVADGVTATAGEAFPWTITITNEGTGVAQTVTATDSLPEGWDNLGVTQVTRNGDAVDAADWGFDSDSLVWTFNDVVPGEAIAVTHTATPTSAAYEAPGAGVGPNPTGPGNPHVNAVAITWTDVTGASANGDGDYVGPDASANAFLHATDVAVQKTRIGTERVWTGDEVSFALTARNLGPQSADGVVITDTLPAGLTFTGASAPFVADSAIWNCAVTGDTLECALRSALAADRSASVTLNAIALAPEGAVLSTEVTNAARVSTTTPETNPDNNRDDDTVRVWATPSIRIDKTADENLASTDPSDDDTQYVLDGQDPARIAHFTITVTNDGPVALQNVVVTDPLAASCGHAALPDLAPGESTSFDCAGPAPSATGYTNTASVTAESLNGDPVRDSDDSRVELSAISIEKTGTIAQPNPQSGDLVEYSFTVTNTGSATLDGVTVSDELPGLSPITFGAWPDSAAEGTLAPGQTVGATASYPLTQADIDRGEVANTAKTEGTDASGQRPRAEDTASVRPGNAPSIALLKTGVLETAPHAKAGDLVSYTFRATNTGNVTLSDVEINDPMTGLGDLVYDWSAASVADSLAPGEWVEATTEYRLSQADVDAGRVDNEAEVVGTPPTGGDVTDTDNTTVEITPQPLIKLVKDGALAAGATGKAGDTIEFVFEASNVGSVTLQGVTITDPLTGLSKLSFDWSTASAEGVLSPGESVTASAHYTLTQADVDTGAVHNTATTVGTPPSGPSVEDSDNATVVVPEQPSIALTKTGALEAGAEGRVGDTVEYTFTAQNTGNVTLRGVSIDDTSLPELSALRYGAWPADAGVLAPGESVTATASYTLVQDDIELGYVDNTATTEGTSPRDTAVDDDDTARVTTLQAPAIELVKTGDFADGETGAVGDTVEYRFVATNTGNVTLRTVAIADPLPGLSALDFTWPGARGVLKPGEQLTATATYTVTQADVDAGEIVNTATVSGTPPSGSPVQDSDDATVNPPQEPRIGLEKNGALAEGVLGVAGDTVEYSFTATNTGNVTLHNVTITDPLPGISEITLGPWPTAAGVLAPGESVTATAQYVLSQADVDAGAVHNTATATGNPAVGAPVTDDDDATVETLRSPAILLDKEGEFAGGAGGVVGGTVEYTFTATNNGTVTLRDVVIADPLPGLSAVGYVNWPGDAGVLAPGESVTATASLPLTLEHIDAGSIENTATVTGVDPTDNIVTAEDEVTMTVTQTPQIAIEKTASLQAGGIGAAGEKVYFVMLVTNTGNVTLTDVAVTDSMPGLSPLQYGAWPADDGVLAPGETVTVTADYTLTEIDVTAGVVTNEASVSGTSVGEDGVTVTVDDETAAALTLPAPPIPAAPGGSIASTGFEATPWALVGAAVLALGGMLFWFGRMRRSTR